MLALIGITLVNVARCDDTETSETVVDDNYDENEITDKVVDEEVHTDENEDTPSDDNQPQIEEEPPSEDTVDVDIVPVEKHKGKYMNYDDYFVASAVDSSDTSYNWNGE